MPDRRVNPNGWGPPPRQPSNRAPRGRGWFLGVAAVSVVLGVVALANANDATPQVGGSSAAPTTSSPLPTVTTSTTLATTTTAPPTTVATVEVPKLVGMRLASARAALAERGLRATVRYKVTAGAPAGTVISQSRGSGAGVLPGGRVTVVIAKAPPPPPTAAPPPPSTAPSRNCDPSYPDVCLDPNAEDYDCAGGSGNGPRYVEGPIRVRPPDPFDLDREGDGWGCERG
jgi:PASTA domain